ncbi:hypothetical protein SETIT_4G216100v2 [Setaria italica]|uniref:Alpha-L-arabinofuranosidase B arabinose-binding domain-containing protein n=1 Tax=Setaria italica TaxID=4555 RepID=A0A368QWV6_SETIT|nr:hypothetical protein SETIT_4G216100v2 [Setaria italica]
MAAAPWRGAWPAVVMVMGVAAKECTNIPTELSSHTVRARLEAADDPGAPEWRLRELFRGHLTSTDEAAWMDLMPPCGGLRAAADDPVGAEEEEFDWAMLYRSLKGQQLLPGGGGGSRVSLHDVRLDPDGDAAYGRAQRTNLEYLLLLDVDSLVWRFRAQAGLPAPGEPYGGWEARELRGHFVGHYLSATAKMWASTHNATLAGRMSAAVDALHECQRAAGTGYLSAFPTSFFDLFEAIPLVWAPYYTIHKIMQGLLDQHAVAGNGKALGMVVAMADYFAGRVANVIRRHSIERHWTSLKEETGGMNDVLYQLYTITADSLSGFHANTHIPVVVGGQMRYEVTGDPLYKTCHDWILRCFFVRSDPKRLAEALTTETQESCTTYNMLKVSRHLFRWTKEVAYVDYYERALINGVLSIQRGRDPGVMIYMLTQGPGSSKARSSQGWELRIESFSKLGDSIYFEEKGEIPTLYIIQFIPSTFNWRTAGLTVTQQVMPLSSSDQYLRVSFSISAKTNGQFATLNVRIPSWTSLNGAKTTLNDKDLKLASPDDRPEYACIQAVLFGPFLLAGLTTGDWDAKTGRATAAPSDWITPVPPESDSQLVTLVQESGGKAFVLSAVNGSLKMKKRPKDSGGTDAAVHATFRLATHEASGSSAMLEPLGMPGMVVTEKLTVSAEKSLGALFNVVPGLDGALGSVSLELGGDVLKHGGGAGFRRAASFARAEPLRRYHLMSFDARGVRRSFLLEPLFTLRDESYTIYFNLVA